MGNYTTLLDEQDLFTDQNKELVKAKEFIKTILANKPAFRVKFSNTIVLTTAPEKWEQYKNNKC